MEKTDCRYFKREWEEQYYIFDSKTISEKEFDEKVEYEDYQAFADSMSGDEVVNRLNELDRGYVDEFSLRETLQLELQRVEKENEQLKEEVKSLREDLGFIDMELQELEDLE